MIDLSVRNLPGLWHPECSAYGIIGGSGRLQHLYDRQVLATHGSHEAVVGDGDRYHWW